MQNHNVHLRHIIEFGVAIEARGKIFYEGLAEKAKDAKAKELFYRLSQDEVRHGEILERILAQWETLPMSQEIADILEREMVRRGIFADPPSEYSSEEDVAKYAIDQEKRIIDFYRSFERSIPDYWKLVKLTQVMIDEMRLVSDLVARYPQLKSFAML